MSTLRTTLLACGFLCAQTASGALASDILVGDNQADAVIRINSVDGTQTQLTTTAFDAKGLAFDAAGDLYVADATFPGAIHFLDLDTGAIGPSFTGGLIRGPHDMTSTSSGLLLVADRTSLCAVGTVGAVYTLDTATGDQTLISCGGFLNKSHSIAVESDGSILVAAQDFGGGDDGALLRIDPATGVQSPFAMGIFENILGVAVATNGDIFVADGNAGGAFPGDGSIIRVDPITQEQKIVSEGGNFRDPQEIAIDGNGHLLVSDPAADSIIKVDPGDGTQSVLSTGSLILNPVDVIVIPENNLTPEQLIAELVNDVIALNLKKGISNALDAKLDHSLAALEDTNDNNDVSAINTLEAFINSVEAQRGKEIDEADADGLVTAAQAIIDELNAI